MKEQDYITVRELSDVLMINHLLRQSITPEHTDAVSHEDYVTVVRIVTEWREKLFEKAKKK